MLSFLVFLGDMRRVVAIFFTLWLVSPGGLPPAIGLPLGIAASLYALYACLRRRSSWTLLVMALCVPAVAVLSENAHLVFVAYLIALLVYMLLNAGEPRSDEDSAEIKTLHAQEVISSDADNS